MNIAWLVWITVVTGIVMLLLLIIAKSRPNHQPTGKIRQAKLLASLVVAVMIPSVSIILYSKLGAYTQLSEFYSSESIAYRKRLKTIQTVAAKWNARELKLKLELQNNSQNATAWRELAALYIFKQDIEAATTALQQASALDTEDQELFINYVMHLLKTDAGILQPQQQARLEDLITNEQYKNFALNLLAINSFKNKNYAVAQKYWQQLLASLPEDTSSENSSSKNTRVEIGRLIAQAEANINKQ